LPAAPMLRSKLIASDMDQNNQEVVLPDCVQQKSVLGASVALIAGVEPASSLEFADVLMQRGASVELCVPIPRSGSAAHDEAALRLLMRIQRVGFPQLMEQLGFRNCEPRALSAGNRPRVTWSHVRVDDVEMLHLLLASHDMLLLSSGAPPLLDEAEERARFGMQRQILGFLASTLRRRGLSLRRDRHYPQLRWTWLKDRE